MADFNSLTYFHLTGLYNGIVGDTTGQWGDAGPDPDLYNVNMDATITPLEAAAGKPAQPATPELRLTTADPPRTMLMLPITAAVQSGVLRLPGADTGIDGVQLVALSDTLDMGTTALLYQVVFGPATIGGRSYQFAPITFAAPAVQLADYHANEVQTVTITGAPTGGNWWLVYGNTPMLELPPTATALDVQNGLQAIPAIGTAATVAGPAGGPYVVTFDTARIARPLRLGALDNLTGGNLPGVKVTDAYTPVTVDLTTVERWAA